MSVGGKRGLKRGKEVDDATIAAAAHADVFVTEGRQRKESQKNYELAKCGLLEYLGDEVQKTLPDGRTITRTDANFAEAHIDRKAYVATTVTVGPPPAAA